MQEHGLAEEQHVLLADAPENSYWNAPVDATEFIYTGDPGVSPVKITLAKDALRQSSSIDLQVQTDGGQCVLGSGGESMAVPISSDEVLLQLTLGGVRPRLTVNGIERPADKGKWIRICAQDEANLCIEIPKATYATIILQQSVMPSTAPVDVTASAPTTNPTTNPSLAERMKRSVFKISTFDKQGQETGNGTGFLIDEKGHALTNFHVVHGAPGGFATFMLHEDEKLPVELIQVFPDRDLAVLQIALPSGERANEYVPLKFRERTPDAGVEVFAIGFPLFLGYTVNKGVISGFRRYGDLQSLFPDLSYAPNSRWLQTDCTINSGNSGGPLLDTDGRVVGVNTWVMLKDMARNIYFALDARDAQDALSTLPDQPLTFAAALTQFPVKTPQTQFLPNEFPPVTVGRATTPDNVTASAHSLAKGFSHACEKCRGKGQVTVKVLVGREGDGLLQRKIYESRSKVCDECQGTGTVMSEPQVIYRLAGNFIKSLAALQTSDARLQIVLVQTRGIIAAGIRNNPMALMAINDRVKAIPGLANPTPNTPMIGTGEVLTSYSTKDGKGQIYVVAFVNSSRLLLVDDPILSEPTGTGFVFVGGICAGTVNIPGAESVVVLRRGFMMSIDLPDEGNSEH
jgi:S1-C subfamily serine protease